MDEKCEVECFDPVSEPTAALMYRSWQMKWIMSALR